MNKQTPVVNTIASRGMATFHCLGSDCEDSCCNAGWPVPYDQESFERLQAAMSSSIDERAELIRTIRVNRNPAPGEPVAFMPNESRGACSMLDSDRLCRLQRRYGEPVLSNACASYPRVISRVGAQVTMFGRLSCPEVVRRTIVEPDGTDMVPAPRDSLGRGHTQASLDRSDPSDYRRSYQPVNNLLHAIARLDSAPLRSRLFFMAVFANETRELLTADVAGVDGPQLMGMIQSMAQPELLGRLHSELAQLPSDTPQAIAVVRAVFAMQRTAMAPKLSWLLDLIAPGYEEKGAPLGGDLAALGAAYRGFDARLSPSVDDKIDGLLARYVLDHIQRDWFITQPSLIHYVAGLLIRVATVRFLLISHPLVVTAGDGELAPIEADLDAAFVDVVSALARTLDHNPQIMAQLLGKLATADMLRLSDLVALLKL